MIVTRRSFIEVLAAQVAATGLFLAYPTQTEACTYGKWKVVCPVGHTDMVDDATCQHKCSQCGRQCFSGNTVTVLCPRGHRNTVTSACDKEHCTQHQACSTCGIDCRFG